MNWYQLTEQEILPFSSKAHAYYEALQRGISITEVKKLSLTPFSIKEFVSFLAQIIHHCKQGHSLQSAMMHSTSEALNSKDRLKKLAIKSSLARGNSVREALMPLVPKTALAFVAIIPNSGTEENIISALEVTKELVRHQIDFTHQLLRSLFYPFGVIQCALVMALLNQLINNHSSIFIGVIWLLISVIQISLGFWVASGAAPPLLAKYITSFRSYMLLKTLTAQLESGETLQTAVKNLCQGCRTADLIPLHRAYLYLQGGHPVCKALPKEWFPNASHSLLSNVHNTGDLISPLNNAAQEWKKRNDQILKLYSKGIPILGIVVASIFVAHTLIQLYAPLMEVNTFAI